MTQLAELSPLASALCLRLPTPRQSRAAVVAFTGSGGKTACAESLAQDAATVGCRTILTTTTKMRLPAQLYPIRTVADVREAVRSHPHQTPIIVGEKSDKKMIGPPPSLLDEVADGGLVDLVVIEADGSRGASIKGYREGEPVLPRLVSRVCVLVGVDAVGATQQSAQVHRGALLWSFLGLPATAALQVEDVARCLFEQPGYLDRAPHLPISIIINKVDDAAATSTARRMLGAFEPYLPRSAVDQVLFRGLAANGGVSVAWQRTRQPVSALLLAAGESKRFGAPKQLIEVHGKPMVTHCLEAFRSVASVVVVVGSDADAVQRVLPADTIAVVNPAFREGMAASIQAGLRAVSAEVEGVLIALADMPRLRAATVDRIVQAASSTPLGIVAPCSKGRLGHPVFFARRHFEALRDLRGDIGGASILRANPHDLLEVPVDDDGIFADVDYPADVAAGLEPPRLR